jgi:hypothetical protein
MTLARRYELRAMRAGAWAALAAIELEIHTLSGDDVAGLAQETKHADHGNPPSLAVETDLRPARLPPDAPERRPRPKRRPPAAKAAQPEIAKVASRASGGGTTAQLVQKSATPGPSTPRPLVADQHFPSRPMFDRTAEPEPINPMRLTAAPDTPSIAYPDERPPERRGNRWTELAEEAGHEG